MTHEILHPKHWKPARGYANGVAAEGRMVFTGGLIGWNANCEFETDDFVGQVEQALRSIVEVLACAGAGPEHLVRLTWYVTDKHEYLASLKAPGAAGKPLDPPSGISSSAQSARSGLLICRPSRPYGR